MRSRLHPMRLVRVFFLYVFFLNEPGLGAAGPFSRTYQMPFEKGIESNAVVDPNRSGDGYHIRGSLNRFTESFLVELDAFGIPLRGMKIRGRATFIENAQKDILVSYFEKLNDQEGLIHLAKFRPGSGFNAVYEIQLSGFAADQIVALPEEDGFVIARLVDLVASQRAEVIRIGTHGEVVWAKRFEITGEFDGLILNRTADGGLVMAVNSGKPRVQGAVVLRLDEAGGLKWSRQMPAGGTSPWVFSLPTLDGGAAGYMAVAASGPGVIGSAVAKLAANGDVQWAREFGTLALLSGLVEAPDGDVVVLGKVPAAGSISPLPNTTALALLNGGAGAVKAGTAVPGISSALVLRPRNRGYFFRSGLGDDDERTGLLDAGLRAVNAFETFPEERLFLGNPEDPGILSSWHPGSAELQLQVMKSSIEVAGCDAAPAPVALQQVEASISAKDLILAVSTPQVTVIDIQERIAASSSPLNATGFEVISKRVCGAGPGEGSVVPPQLRIAFDTIAGEGWVTLRFDAVSGAQGYRVEVTETLSGWRALEEISSGDGIVKRSYKASSRQAYFRIVSR